MTRLWLKLRSGDIYQVKGRLQTVQILAGRSHLAGGCGLALLNVVFAIAKHLPGDTSIHKACMNQLWLQNQLRQDPRVLSGLRRYEPQKHRPD